jgi:hypothetical protein
MEPNALLKSDLYAITGSNPCNLIKMPPIKSATKTAIIGINQEPTSNFFFELSRSDLVDFVSLIIGYLIGFLKKRKSGCAIAHPLFLLTLKVLINP